MSDDLRERLAALAHEQWRDWMRYFLGKCGGLPNGAYVVPANYAANLRALMDTPYAELPEAQKDSDRAEADKVLALLEVQR